MEITIDNLSLKPVFQYIPEVHPDWTKKDMLGAISVRWGFGRDNYKVTPGLYRIGNPDSQSDVFISANYKLSFDHLRKNLAGLHAWILVIDTKGINVWCAAGKGTFGTDNLIRSIKSVSLDQIVQKKRIILPQLAAPGIAAHIVKERTGFKVLYGPVLAKDIRAFIQAGYKAGADMRKMTFPLKERARLIPVDLLYGKYRILIAIAVVIVLSGLDKSGIQLSKIINTGLFPVVSIISAYLAGIVITPLLLPYLPFRPFSVKGAISGLSTAVILSFIFNPSVLEMAGLGFTGISIASFTAMNFTGSSTFTSLSGVKKEMKWSIPFQLLFALTGIALFIVSKIG